MIDQERLLTHQRALARQAVETAPANVTEFTIDASESGNTMPVKVIASRPFVLSEAATASLREIFVLFKQAGIPIKGLRCEMKERPNDRTWSLAMEYDYV